MPRRSLATRLAIIVPGVLLASSLSLWWVHATTSASTPVAVTVTPDVPVFNPRVVLVHRGQPIEIHNTTAQPLEVTTTAHNPASFHLTVAAGATERLTLNQPGRYHYYDAATAHVIDYAAGNDVVHALPGAPDADLANQGWIDVADTGELPVTAHIMVPNSNDLLDPMVAVIPVGGSVIIHNHDTDPHNLVTDPADPTGVAFELLGTDGEPAIQGAERQITFTEPGLYHLYCSIHSRVVGKVGQWQVVVPRDSKATGFPDHNPMESWILVVQ